MQLNNSDITTIREALYARADKYYDAAQGMPSNAEKSKVVDAGNKCYQLAEKLKEWKD